MPGGFFEWHAPVRNPCPKICCLALNNSGKRRVTHQVSGPKHPAMFVTSRPARSLATADILFACPNTVEPIRNPSSRSSSVSARNTSKPRTRMNTCFGYTIHNDITSPTMRGEDTRSIIGPFSIPSATIPLRPSTSTTLAGDVPRALQVCRHLFLHGPVARHERGHPAAA